ncbi:FAD-dependent oxidoreductase [Devosia sp. XJ19-1]|uniref:FAD-dependent oxidoreductase n=1 Tax=Devosia ureilytica TaxID=2952754 RepID=A0A9Q4AMC3_9HYPH|nr:FAD-dependent oxidoreductase [Devosia ureilytica]MCP8883297.1 FAD-dependent oxidoreductase [Devosia ureilytica]MCP8886335.1 FAD-dependent oxidoreductase [Devosia ureilytica]
MFHAASGFSGSHPARQRVAVVGSGVSGLSAAWLLSKSHDVVLYEADGRPGGHANTIDVPGTGPVDTGFIVYNESNYPNFTAMMAHLGVESIRSQMSFSASLDQGRFEYCGEGLGGLLAQKRNAFRPRFWNLFRDLLRFYREAPEVLDRPDLQKLTLDEYLQAQRYSQSFVDDHLLPLAAAIWSSSATDIRSYPLLAFVRFFQSHNLLQIWERPNWRTVKGGSRAYVTALLAQFSGQLRLSTPVASIERDASGVTVIDMQGHKDRFDQVLIASHADQALGMLAAPSVAERNLLGAFNYTLNTAVLHADASFMPRLRRVWSCWNYIAVEQEKSAHPLCVSYWMNRLQSLPGRDLFVTLNPPHNPQNEIARFEYTHPLFDSKAIHAQENLWQIQGENRTWYAGAHFGRGFHEDGLQAGLAAAEAMGALPRPWSVANPSGRITLAPPAAALVA